MPENNAVEPSASVYIPLSLIDLPSDVRTHTLEALNSLSHDMAQNGQLQEILVEAGEAGRYLVIAGAGRVSCARKLGWEKIRAAIKSGITELDKVMLTISENDEREDFTPVDRGAYYKKALEVGGISQAELARRLDKTEACVSIYLAIASLSPEVRETLTRVKTPFAHIREIMRLKDPAKQIALAEMCAKDDLSVKELKKLVDKLAGKELAPPAPAKHGKEADPLEYLWEVLRQNPELKKLGNWKVAYKGKGVWDFTFEIEGRPGVQAGAAGDGSAQPTPLHLLGQAPEQKEALSAWCSAMSKAIKLAQAPEGKDRT